MRIVSLVAITLTLVLSPALFSDNVAHSAAAHPRALATQLQERQHEGQPESCNNMADNTHKCDCHKTQQCDAPGESHSEDPKCQVYCRPDACKCVSSCTT
jgi:hypothetical protein